ncbi:ABC transporter permease subunit, partial [Klebsiella pneumoniae]|nr:ABC transporter permease subunit [Klebsiella pneumoniae]
PVLIRTYPMLLWGLWVTIKIGVVSILLGLALGLLLALARLYGPRVIRSLAGIYIDIMRSIPILVLLIIIYYALPFLGVR